MKKAILLIFVLINITTISHGQKTEKIFLNPSDTTVNSYLAIYPPKLPWTGFLFLIPSFGETPEMVLNQTDLPKIAAEKGLLTIIPTFSTGVLSFGVDSLTQQSFKKILTDVTNKHKLIDQRFFIGGFSIGGSCAVKYAETALAENFEYKPTAIFAIDPPLDFERFYNSSMRMIRLGIPSQEAHYMIQRITVEMEGTPENAIANYYNLSPYSFSDTTQTAIKKIRNLPIRIYTEPDINWWIKERAEDVTGMNVVDCSAMINELKLLGNNNATLILTENKGYRQPNNRRHPHSWSIANSSELIDWLLKQR